MSPREDDGQWNKDRKEDEKHQTAAAAPETPSSFLFLLLLLLLLMLMFAKRQKLHNITNFPVLLLFLSLKLVVGRWRAGTAAVIVAKM
jgi:hypothetical protein